MMNQGRLTCGGCGKYVLETKAASMRILVLCDWNPFFVSFCLR